MTSTGKFGYVNLSTAVSNPLPIGPSTINLNIDAIPVPLDLCVNYVRSGAQKILIDAKNNAPTDPASQNLLNEILTNGLNINKFSDYCSQVITDLTEPAIKSFVDSLSNNFYQTLTTNRDINDALKFLSKGALDTLRATLTNETQKSVIGSLCPADGCTFKDFYKAPCRLIDQNVISVLTKQALDNNNPLFSQLLIPVPNKGTPTVNDQIIGLICSQGVNQIQNAFNFVKLSKYPACKKTSPATEPCFDTTKQACSRTVTTNCNNVTTGIRQ